MSIEFLIAAIVTVVGLATPILLAGLGELVTEKSGVLNLGVEGMMLIGAIAGVAACAAHGLSHRSKLEGEPVWPFPS